MRLRVLFVQYADDVMPNAMVITDDYMEDEHGGIPEYWDEECKKVNESGSPTREAFITVPDDMVSALFRPPSVLMSHIRAVERTTAP